MKTSKKELVKSFQIVDGKFKLTPKHSTVKRKKDLGHTHQTSTLSVEKGLQHIRDKHFVDIARMHWTPPKFLPTEEMLAHRKAIRTARLESNELYWRYKGAVVKATMAQKIIEERTKAEQQIFKILMGVILNLLSSGTGFSEVPLIKRFTTR